MLKNARSKSKKQNLPTGQGCVGVLNSKAVYFWMGVLWYSVQLAASFKFKASDRARNAINLPHRSGQIENIEQRMQC